MHSLRSASIFLGSLLLSVPAITQQPPLAASEVSPERDPQAVALVQQAVAAIGGIAPADSVATGTVYLVAGSKADTGTIRILTRGMDQTAEEIVTPEGTRQVVYSREQAREAEGNSAKPLQLELAVTSQSACFPLPLLAAALNHADTGFQYLGQETLDGLAVHHIRFWNTFSSHPKLRHLAEFSMKDLWIDAATGLPRKLSFDRRAAGGAEPRIPVELFFSDYRNVSGVLYPFRIEKHFNGTPWANITINNVQLNAGLTDAAFPVE